MTRQVSRCLPTTAATSWQWTKLRCTHQSGRRVLDHEGICRWSLPTRRWFAAVLEASGVKQHWSNGVKLNFLVPVMSRISAFCTVWSFVHQWSRSCCCWCNKFKKKYGTDWWLFQYWKWNYYSAQFQLMLKQLVDWKECNILNKNIITDRWGKQLIN